MHRSYLVLPLLVVLVAGCVTTKKRYQDAFAQEQAGNWVAAAEGYIQVLEKDRNYEDARARLQDTGERAITLLWNTVEDLESTGTFALAVRELDRMQALRDGAEGVNVILTLPDAFEDRRSFMVEAALDAILRDAEDAMVNGQPDRALDLLEGARRDYVLSDDRQFEVDHRLADALLTLARADLAAGRPKSGYDTALRAVEILDPYDDDAEIAARELADLALAEGIRVLALVPFWRTETWQRNAPEDLRADMNDAIAFGEAGRRSEFIAVLDPGKTRRGVRAMTLDAKVLTRAEMRDIGQELDSDYVLAGEFTGFLENERIRRTRERDARTRGRGGVDTTYTWRQMDIRLQATAAWRVLDVVTGEFVLEGTAESDARGRFERATYPGNWRSLDLPGSEQLLFDPEEWARQDRQLHIELSDKLAERIMRRVEDGLERLID
ncbi:MAG: hypothetical protein JJ896_15860 [Rhodothermales bacterium]|nr:hypothetical protein [Rhodothermales bacterium]MBO6781131.1 hypothetical protein [Rhodothermales bacterium]